jgi:hypothetical protein
MFFALLFLSFLPCIIKTVQRFLLDRMSAIANQKFSQLYLQGYKPSRMQELEDLAPYNAPCQQEAAKETDALPQFLILNPYPHHY